ncbi:MAG: hypothetical protein JWN40_4478, partial [Phycisphaerales bacterium]|nr:hypothetical protein [Phycisphaerales bacterium]
MYLMIRLKRHYAVPMILLLLTACTLGAAPVDDAIVARYAAAAREERDTAGRIRDADAVLG